jgi:transposase
VVTAESTSDYWRIFFYPLEARGLTVQLVNARDVKNAPGRPKTDTLDAVWLAKLTGKGLLRPRSSRPQRSGGGTSHELRSERRFPQSRAGSGK